MHDLRRQIPVVRRIHRRQRRLQMGHVLHSAFTRRVNFFRRSHVHFIRSNRRIGLGVDEQMRRQFVADVSLATQANDVLLALVPAVLQLTSIARKQRKTHTGTSRL